MIHLNLRSAKKIFEKLKDFLYQLPQYTAIHQNRSPSHKSGRGGGISMYIHDSLNFKSRRELDINTKNVESLSIELISKN